MTAEPIQDLSGLRWIRPELDENLRQARMTLEDFVEGDREDLNDAIQALHEVQGALSIAGVYGGAMLGDELERLANAMNRGQLARKEAAAEVLMLGIAQLPAYLERIEQGEPDIPLVLLPLMNDLRAARDAPLVSETSLFAPKLNVQLAAEPVVPGSGNPELAKLVQTLRINYHRGLLKWLRELDVRGGLADLRDVVDQVSSAAGTPRLRHLLDAAEALLVALLDDSVENSVAVRLLFGRIDRVVFKTVIDAGEEAAVADFPLELLKNLLYYVARSDSVDPVVQAVRRSADLANSFPEISAEELHSREVGGAGRELFDAVAGALEEDLAQIKDRLDLYMRDESGDLQRIGGLVDPLRRMGDTLGMIGRGDLRARLVPHSDAIQGALSQDQVPEEGALELLAGDLLAVESALPGLSETRGGLSAGEAEAGETASPGLQMSRAEYRQYVQVVVDEAAVEMSRIKEALGVYLTDATHVQILSGMPSKLHTIAGALTVVEQSRVAAVVDGLGQYLGQVADDEREAPTRADADTLADLLSGVEYYLEYLFRPSPNHAYALDVAEQSLQRLCGRDVATHAPVSAEEADEEDEIGEPAAVDTISEETSASTLIVDKDSSVTAEQDEDAGGEPLSVMAGMGEAESAGDGDALEQPSVEVVAEDTEEPPVEVAAEESPVEAATEEPAEAEEDELDSEILAIFVEEAREEVEVIQEQYPLWREDAGQEGALTRIRRSFHTLKGSGRLVGAMEIGELAWSIENLLNRIIDGTLPPGPAILQLLDETVVLLPDLVDARENGGGANPRTLPLQEQAFALANGEVHPQSEEKAPEVAAEVVEEPAGEDVAATAEVASEPEAPALELPDAEDLVEDFDTASVVDDDLAEYSLILDLDEQTEPVPEPDSDSREWVASETVSGESILATVPDREAAKESDDSQWAPSQMGPDESILTPVVAEKAPIEIESTLFDIFTREADEHLAVLKEFVGRCRGQAGGCVYEETLCRALHTLRGSAHMAEVVPIATLAAGLEKWANLSSSLEHRTDQAGIDLLERGHNVLSSLAGVINQPGAGMPAWEVLQQEVEQQIVLLEHQASGEADTEDSVETEAYDEELAAIFMEEARELIDALEAGFSQWHENAEDLLPVTQMQRSLHTMKGGARLASLDAIGDLAHATESLFESIVNQRIPTTSGAQDLARHAFDALAGQVETLEQGTGTIAHHPDLVESLEAAARGESVSLPVVELQTEVEEVPDSSPSHSEAYPESPPRDEDEVVDVDSTLLSDSHLMTDSELLAESDLAASSSLVLGDGDLTSNLHGDSRVIQFPARGRHAVDGEDAEPPRRPPPPEEQKPTSKSKERVRVRADLLDQMVNNAGEVSIYRARLEQQNKTLGHNLDELSQTIGRLREQLRQLEIETEAQILSRHEREHDGDVPAGFDPLEMDRYSTIQQLSRALSETTEDLNSIGTTMGDLNRDTDTLLQQQARIANDLQDRLLRTRMVPVGSRAARLQRVVRQTAQTLGKVAELKIAGAQGEMDRAILERMMGPLEHLLRNAVAHGIESPDERKSAGKPEGGKISLEVGREGSDVVLTVSDDGCGLDREAIRRKAEERGLIDPGAAIDGKDLDAFILEAGLSTTGEVSQVSGRGVGMDVVVNEVKQLGGNLEIESRPGKGSSFTIRLPFTLAISEALLVGVGDEIYAVPHGSMDGIARISRSDLDACYRGEKDGFSYGGIDYGVRYLGSMLGLGSPQLPESERWLPILLIRSGEQRIAIQVDHLLGNRQIVVKSVGTQLSSIRWFSGGTILADGSLALILDMGALVRMATAHQQHSADQQPEEVLEPQSIKVMVVDDSITVRKVTSRLLERHNMQVITARDGVDAVALLQEERPDVMLLDIEMPRMDGFELARHMRSTEELKDIPIIMITSRTGDKHRLHAVELGVRRYLGKPYQESDLLDNIYTVLAENAQ